MSILFITNSGETLPVAWRLLEEGKDVSIYVHHPRYKHNYDGLIEKVPLRKLLSQIKKASLIVFDILRPNEGLKEDQAFLKLFKLPQNTPELFSAAADYIRKKWPDKLVIGACSETAKWELDRFYGEKIAKQIGLHIPESRRFNSLSEGAKFLKNRTDLWVFKPLNNQDLDLTYVEKFPGELYSKFTGEYKVRLGDKIDYILQKVIKGIEISTEAWWDGEKFVYHNHTIEDKRLMNGNLGPAIGSQNNTVWLKHDVNGLLMENFRALEKVMKGLLHRGPLDINCIIDRSGKPYFLEWSSRLGWDAFYCLASLVKGSLEDLFSFRADFYESYRYASSARITIPPYPYSDEDLLNSLAKDVEIKRGFTFPEFWAEDIKAVKGKIVCAGADGIIGVMAAKGHSLGGSVGNVYRAIYKLQVATYLQYRTDLGRRAEKALRTLSKMGIKYG